MNDNIDDDYTIQNFCREDINNIFKEKVQTLGPIDIKDIQIIKISKDGNCFYQCISFLLTGNEKNYQNIKDIIIIWIEINYKDFVQFFGDDDIHQLKKEDLAQKEFEDIKKRDSWGSYYTIEISCLILNLTIAIYYINK